MSIKKLIISILKYRGFLCCLIIALLFMSTAMANAERTLRVGAFNLYPAIFKDSDGVVKGFYVDLLQNMANKEGWKIEYVYGSWQEGLDRLKNGEVDILTSVAYTDERATYMDYCNEPLITVWSEVYAREHSRIRTMFDLKGKRIGVMKGDFNAQVFIKHMQGFNINCEYIVLPDSIAVMKAVRDNEVDACVVNNTVGSVLSNEYSLTSTDIIFNPFPIYFTVAKDKNNDVKHTLDKYLKLWKDDHHSIYYSGMNSWLRRDVGVKYLIPNIVWEIIAIILLVTVIVFMFNIILRKRVKTATDNLVESERRNRILVERTNDAIFMVNRHTGEYLTANAAAERLTGRSVDELRKSTTHDISPLGSAERINIVAGVNEAINLGEVYYLRPDGTRRTALLEVVPLDDETCFSIARDITERKTAEEANNLLQEQLNQSQKMESIGRLAGGVAHDFNNMLHSILINAEIAMTEKTSVNAIRDNLDEICVAAERSAELTRQLLAFARKQTVTPQVLKLDDAINNIIKMLQRLIGEDIDLAWKPEGDIWPVKIDPSQIDQILTNLCVNSRDAINGNGKISIRVMNDTITDNDTDPGNNVKSGEFVKLIITDTGCGMDNETLSHIYEPFFTTKNFGEGTGLGMATVYGIVQQNNGFIVVNSTVGKGTEICVYLPRYSGEDDNIKEEKPGIPYPENNKITILVTEDEVIILKLTVKMLQKLGYYVLQSKNPLEAVKMAEEYDGNINLLLTDVVMPEMNGHDLTLQLLQKYPDMKTIYMSGYTADVIAKHGIINDGINFIQKPFAIKDLAYRVREALNKVE